MNSSLRCKNSAAAFSKRTFDKALRVARPMAGLLAAVALCASLTGCSMSPIALSGPDTSAVKVSVHVNGTVRGGQNPISGSAVQLWAVGNSGYGSNATNLIGLLPASAGGGYCSVVPDTITSFVITAGSQSNTITFTGNNLLIPGQTFSVSGLTSPKGLLLDGGTFTVSAATSTTFTANTTVPATASTTDSGTATPQCGANEVAAAGTGNEVLSGAGGSFSITGDYTCPSSSSQVYLTASGGNPGLAAGTNNGAIYMVTPLGACGNLGAGTSVIVSEVTTAATAFALGQYFTPTFGASSTDSFGAPNTTQAQLGLANAFATVSSLVNLASGNAITSTPLTGAGYTITAVPDSAKLNTIADILASCVNSFGTADLNGNCTTLFTDVTPTGGTKPTDVLQAAVDMSLNPISNNAAHSASNLTALYNLSNGTGSPFPGLSAAPTDWTLGIQYQDNTGTFLLKAQNVAIDSNGNVWVLSNANNSSGVTGAGGLVEMSPTGTPLSVVTSLNVDGPNNSTGIESSLKTTSTNYYLNNTNFTTHFNSIDATVAPTLNPRNLAIDTNNNIWFSASSSATDATTTQVANGAIFEYIPGGSPSSHGFSTGKGAYGVAIDGNNNVFVSQQSSSAYFGMYEFPGGSFAAPYAFPIPTATAGTAGTTGANSYFAAQYLAVDTSGNLWATIGAGTPTAALELAAITAPAACTPTAPATNCLAQATTSTSANTYNSVALSGSLNSYGIAAGKTSMNISNLGSSTSLNTNYFTLTPTSTANPPSSIVATSYGSATTVSATKAMAVDGGGNVWVGSANASNSAGSTVAFGGISEFTSAGVALSPASSTVSVQTPPGFNHANAVTNTPVTGCTAPCAATYTNVGLGSVSSVAIDPSGNVWLANNVQYAAAVPVSSTNPGTPVVPSSVYELVGAGVPTVTPIALALKNGTVGAKP